MPPRPATPCTYPGCPTLCRDGNARCAKHRAAGKFADRARGSRHARGYGTRWDRLRTFILASEPLCRPCWVDGITTVATAVDHIVPKARYDAARGDPDSPTNLQPICSACHLAKTAREGGGEV